MVIYIPIQLVIGSLISFFSIISLVGSSTCLVMYPSDTETCYVLLIQPVLLEHMLVIIVAGHRRIVLQKPEIH